MPRRITAVVIGVAFSQVAHATVMTNTRPEIAQMAGLWEVDSVQISPLANAQYPTFTATWEYIVPHTSFSADGDIHNNMAVDSSGAGSTGNNGGTASPIVAEIINATQAQLT